ncbi:hypothetical protein F4Y93_15415 [Candidatus Poribacteria bacterium]|nr:hypothetical protein [Candidatus Poribacteria bacterium]
MNAEHNQTNGLDAQRIHKCLTAIRSRMYRQALLQTITAALFCGFVLLAALFILNRAVLLPIQMSLISPIVILIAIAIGIYHSLKQRKDLSFVARFVDQKMGLKERLSTAAELIQMRPQNEFAQRQIQDAAETASTLDIAETSPYRVPKLLKLFPIPLLLIGLSFAIPLFYEVPQPLTLQQQEILDRTIHELNERQVKDSDLQQHIRDTAKKLKTATDFDTAQKHLSDLKKAVRKQQTEQASAIAEATEASQSFRGMNVDQLAAELERLTEQIEIPPELQSELKELFARLAEDLPRGALSDALNQVQGKAATPETLQDIIAALEKVDTSDNLAQLEAQLAASQKELALAAIETETPSGGIANNDGAPGQDIGTTEVQGTAESISDSDPQTESQTAEADAIENRTDSENAMSPLVGEETPILQVNGEQLTLTTTDSGDAQGFSDVFTGQVRDGMPVYLPFSDAVLSASRAYAEAIDNQRIPVRYQTQITAYLEAISKKK